MKYSTQKLLVSLFFQPGASPVLTSAAQLRSLVPELSEGGFRSSLHFLESKGSILKEEVGAVAQYVLTDLGRRRLTEQFPALNPEYDAWRGEWSCLVFLQPPPSDPQFRYLRKLLLKARAVPLARGVYVLHPLVYHRVQRELESLYEGSVAVLTVSRWQFGAERPIVSLKTGLSDVVSAYSGISKEVEELLIKLNVKRGMDHQYKVRILQVYERLLHNLADDPGFIPYFFPGYPRGSELLIKLQRLLQFIG